MRDDFATCPRCGAALDSEGKRWVCTQGCGVLVTEAELRNLVMDMYAERPQTLDLQFEPAQVPEPVRTCPRCTTQMTKHLLYTIVVDRCGEHGVWFDTDELRAILARVGEEHRARVPLGTKIGVGAMAAGYIAIGIARFLLL